MLGRREVLERVAQPVRGVPSQEKPADAPAPQHKRPGKAYAVFDENFFMYGDDLDLCIRMERAGYRIMYDGSVRIIHLKGVSVGKDHAHMARAIFDANRDVYLKHFNPQRSLLVAIKYRVAFALWKWVALLRARLRGHRKVRPL